MRNRLAATEEVKRLALAEGFDLAGVARLTPASTAGAYARWIDDGRHGSMSYLERNFELRADPRGLLAGARSILCVALQYAPRDSATAPLEESSIWPRVARYARGDDYHRFFRKGLTRVARRIVKLFPGSRARACVDTAPLLEREWAARAGLGAVGKNCNLLHPKLGSWLLLGEVLLTLDLQPDPPVADLCGDCSLCLDACPTGALTAPFELDSRRCISYRTIEQRGAFPDGVGEKLSGWLFGCDICQEVCPWNREPPASVHAAFDPPPERARLSLVDLLERGDAELEGALRTTPLLRPGLDGLRRNARALAASPVPPRGAKSPL